MSNIDCIGYSHLRALPFMKLISRPTEKKKHPFQLSRKKFKLRFNHANISVYNLQLSYGELWTAVENDSSTIVSFYPYFRGKVWKNLNITRFVKEINYPFEYSIKAVFADKKKKAEDELEFTFLPVNFLAAKSKGLDEEDTVSVNLMCFAYSIDLSRKKMSALSFQPLGGKKHENKIIPEHYYLITGRVKKFKTVKNKETKEDIIWLTISNKELGDIEVVVNKKKIKENLKVGKIAEVECWLYGLIK